MKAGGFAKW